MNGRILVVDDSLTVRMNLMDMLSGADLPAVACATLAEARCALAEERFALGAASGVGTMRSSANATGWAGTRRATVAPPAVTMSGTREFRESTKVSGPGQNCALSLAAASGHSLVNSWAWSRAAT